MTPLRQRMINDMRIRNFATTTQRSYIHYVAQFAKFFHRDPAELDLEAVRQYQLYLAQERRLKNKSHVGFLAWLPPLETIERIASTTLLIGFPFMTLGLLAGSLIAQESIGPSYFKDPKVLLSFAMWALYLVMLFVRRQVGLRGRRAVYLSSLAFLVVISVWAANQLSSVHRFTAP